MLNQLRMTYFIFIFTIKIKKNVYPFDTSDIRCQILD